MRLEVLSRENAAGNSFPLQIANSLDKLLLEFVAPTQRQVSETN